MHPSFNKCLLEWEEFQLAFILLFHYNSKRLSGLKLFAILSANLI